MKCLCAVCASLLLCAAGCVSGSNYAPLPDIKREMAEKHPVANVLTPYSGDGFFINTGKIALRTLCFIPTLGLSEIPAGRPRRHVIAGLKARNRLHIMDENRKVYAQRREAELAEIRSVLDPLLGKSKTEAIAGSGPPERTFPDGRGGEVFIYREHGRFDCTASSSLETDGGVEKIRYESTPARRSARRKLLYFDQSGKLYRWELK